MVELLRPTFSITQDPETPTGSLELVEFDSAAPVAGRQLDGRSTLPCSDHSLAIACCCDQFAKANLRLAYRNFHDGLPQAILFTSASRPQRAAAFKSTS